MFPKIKKVRAHVERWISGVEGVFQDNGGWISEDAGGFPVRKVDFRQKGVFQTRRVVFRTFQNLKGGFPSLPQVVLPFFQ